jgi:hypothetical protein
MDGYPYMSSFESHLDIGDFKHVVEHLVFVLERAHTLEVEISLVAEGLHTTRYAYNFIFSVLE